ncbi:MAG: hypothetical protein MZV70_20125 [Desulfobacterales bacterium]|nr:hypothetical protein [Desulfobacterales bacterium]
MGLRRRRSWVSGRSSTLRQFPRRCPGSVHTPLGRPQACVLRAIGLAAISSGPGRTTLRVRIFNAPRHAPAAFVAHGDSRLPALAPWPSGAA